MFMLTFGHLCSSTPLIILKDLKCEYLDRLGASIIFKHSVGPDGLTCCSPLVEAIGM